MRILLLTTHLNIGGISTYTVTLAKALKAKGESVFVASSGGVLVPELTAGDVSHLKVDLSTKSELSPKVFRAVFEITKIVKAVDIDVIHAQTRVAQVVGFFVSRLCKVGFITTCHGFFRKNIGRTLLPSWGERVIAISDAVQSHLLSYFRVDRHKVALIYNGIDVKKFLRDFSEKEKDDLKDRFGIKKDHSIIGTISRFTPDKGHDVLLYALYNILKQKPNVQLVFVGEGKEYLNIVNLAYRLNLTENVIFIKPQINTVNILSILDVFMFAPRRKEGLGIAAIEALAAGKPVVATDVGGIRNVIEDGVNGFLVPPSRPEFLVEPTLKLLKQKELYKKMSQAGREIVIERFSINGMVDKVAELYREIEVKS
ncbi:MAG: glycosyltransferase family 4 protein [Candidatus Omnitrophica bacterium]|nr:glycosyltransferase family 4 protein [Candidatus Omnitrophota bacterium]MBU1853820.1 glycosyltransferase family 4 protein [Candidatus Omnitrophota bacterium]